MAKLEAGQRAYEAWCGSHGRDPAWRLLHPLDQLAWKAAEQACAVPAASDESQSSWTFWGESTPELGAYYWLRFSDCTARRPAQYRNDKYSGPGFFYEEGREHGGIVAFVRARPPAWSVERRAVPAATQNDNATETSEQWRRAVLAWQEWATALCVHPDGGLLGDGTMRDQLRERLAEAGKAQPPCSCHSCEVLPDLHEQVAQMCEYLGSKREDMPCDSWHLRDLIVRLKVEAGKAQSDEWAHLLEAAELLRRALSDRMGTAEQAAWYKRDQSRPSTAARSGSVGVTTAEAMRAVCADGCSCHAGDYLRLGGHGPNCDLAANTPQPPAPDSDTVLLLNLLARIHGDGGHRVIAAGVKQACAEADLMVAKWRAESDQETIAAARKCIEAADEMRTNWSANNLTRHPLPAQYDRARAEFDKVTLDGGESKP